MRPRPVAQGQPGLVWHVQAQATHDLPALPAAGRCCHWKWSAIFRFVTDEATAEALDDDS